jgi:E3 ubiquitin-protein ligase TRIP12
MYHNLIYSFLQESKTIEALKELRSVVVESDISSFEVNHSGLIGALLAFLTEESGYRSPRENRLRSFVHVFADSPVSNYCPQ